MPRFLKTSDIARDVGVHVNTVRLYEARGFLSPVPRSATGYRQFEAMHLEQMRLARLALWWPYVGDRRRLEEMVRRVAEGDLGRAMELAHAHLADIRVERTRAEAAVEFLERWAQGPPLETTTGGLWIGQAAEHLGVTADQLRNWDRNGLLDVPRDDDSGYRMYGAAELGRARVIRVLRQSGYSLMAILRMLRQFDAGKREKLREALDTPGDNEDIQTLADRWLSTLQEEEERGQAIIRQITVIAESIAS